MDEVLKAPAAGLLTQCFIFLLGQQLCILRSLDHGEGHHSQKSNAEGLCITPQSQAGRLGSLEDATVEYSW